MTPADPSAGPPTDSGVAEIPEEAAPPEGSADASAPSPSGGGRSRSFRERQLKAKSARRELVGQIAVVVIIVLGVVAIVSARTGFSPSHGGFPAPGTPITVSFGTPVQTTANCTGGGTAYVVHIPWLGSSQPVTTGDVYARVYEIWDGDNIGDPGAVANATPSNVCAGTPPSSTALWYVVLAGSNGTNLVTYTAGSGWVSLSHSSANFVVPGGCTVVLVTGSPIAGTGRGFAVGGFASGSPISGNVAL